MNSESVCAETTTTTRTSFFVPLFRAPGTARRSRGSRPFELLGRLLGPAHSDAFGPPPAFSDGFSEGFAAVPSTHAGVLVCCFSNARKP